MSRSSTRSSGRLRRAWGLLALVSGAALALGACGGGGSTGGGGGSGEKVKLTYFNARGAEPVERALIKKYMTDHPNVSVEYLATTSLAGPSDTDAIANLIFNIQSHTVIDVAKVEVGRTPLDLMAAKASRNLSKIDEQAVKDRLGQLTSANLVSFSSGVWALPYENDPFGYVYNANLLKQAGINNPPQTWDEWRQDNRTIKQKFPDTWPICHPIVNLSKIQPLVWSAGGTYWDKDILPTKADFQNRGMVDAYSFIQEWAQNGWMNTSDINATTSIQWMVSHKCAAMDYSSNLAATLRFNDPNTDWKVAPIPGKDKSHKPVNFVGGSALVVPSTAKHPKESLEFIRWLTSQEGQDLKYGVDNSLGLSQQDIFGQALPTNKRTAEKLSQDKKWKESLATINVPSRPPGVSPAYSKSYQLLAEMQQRIVLKRNNVDQELAATQQQVQQLLDQSVQQNPDLYKK